MNGPLEIQFSNQKDITELHPDCDKILHPYVKDLNTDSGVNDDSSYLSNIQDAGGYKFLIRYTMKTKYRRHM